MSKIAVRREFVFRHLSLDESLRPVQILEKTKLEQDTVLQNMTSAITSRLRKEYFSSVGKDVPALFNSHGGGRKKKQPKSLVMVQKSNPNGELQKFLESVKDIGGIDKAISILSLCKDLL